MKISNYILTGFLTFVFGLILAMFIDGKLHGDNLKHVVELPPLDIEMLTDFSVLVAEEDSKIEIISDSVNNIALKNYNHKEQKTQQSLSELYKISNDTLFVKKADSIVNLVVRTNSIRKIIGKKNSKINLSGIHNDTLSFELDKSKLTGALRCVSINYLEIIAKNHSDIHFNKLRYFIKKENDKEEVETYIDKLKFAKVSLKNHSKLYMRETKHLNIEADSTSTYSFFK